MFRALRRPASFSVWMMLAASCGDNLVETTDARSGTRLKVRYFELDGAREPTAGFHDRDRDETCWPVAFADGVTYCAPIDPVGPIARTVFTDRACTEQVVEGDGRYAIQEHQILGRVMPSRLWHVGPIAPVPEQTFTWVDGTCSGPVPAEDGSYFHVGEEVPRDQLVALGRREIPLDDRLAIAMHTSLDGLHAPDTLLDRRLGACVPTASPGGPFGFECRPREAIEATAFHDASCTEPVILVPRAVVPPETAFTRDDESGCTSHYRVRLQTGGLLYQHNGGGCVTTFAPAEYAQHLLTPDDVVELHAVTGTVVGSDRYRAITLDGAPSGELFDSTLESPCRIGPAGTCVPRSVAGRLVYRDPKCTSEPLVLVPQRPCDPHAAFAHLDESSPHRYPLSKVVEPGQLFVLEGQCRPFEPRSGFVSRRPLPIVSTTWLPTVTLVIDP